MVILFLASVSCGLAAFWLVSQDILSEDSSILKIFSSFSELKKVVGLISVVCGIFLILLFVIKVVLGFLWLVVLLVAFLAIFLGLVSSAPLVKVIVPSQSFGGVVDYLCVLHTKISSPQDAKRFLFVVLLVCLLGVIFSFGIVESPLNNF